MIKPIRGFTIIELVVVIVVVGILAVTVLPRFANKTDFDQAGFRDQVVAAMQFARKVAVASRRYVCVTVAAGGVTLAVDPRLAENVTAATTACTVGLNLPGERVSTINAPTGVTLGATSFNFDPLGQVAAAVSISITGGRNIRVEQSGYVY